MNEPAETKKQIEEPRPAEAPAAELRPGESKSGEPDRGKFEPGVPHFTLVPNEFEPQAPVSEIDLYAPNLYLNRELTWLNFCRRVLHEAEDERNKLLERVKFLAIVCSNIDEFFMKRIGGLKQQQEAGLSELSIDGHTPAQQIVMCQTVIRELEIKKHKIFLKLGKELGKVGIQILSWEDLSAREHQGLRDIFQKNIFPLVTPQGIDPAHPFPFISNLSLNLLVRLRHPKRGDEFLARVKVPVGPDVPRFLRVGDGLRFILLEDVMSQNLDLLFPQMEVMSFEKFRVTRNAVTELDEDEADDLLAMIETELRYRRLAEVVRLQAEPGMEPAHRQMLIQELGLDEEADVFAVAGMIGKASLHQIAQLDLPHLHDTPHQTIDHPRLLDVKDIFQELRERGPILLFHPFESFTSSVERFLKEASEDPQVRAIKMTLYRTSKDSKVIRYLVRAARNDKQVTVVVELKARFDEAANIQWANQMEEAGIHITYGVVGFKTHSKVILVVRKDPDCLRRYAHIGTGNYHAGTARLYTDFGMLTCDEVIGEDLTEFFNYLTTGYSPNRNYKKLLIAPSRMKHLLLAMIQREIECHKPSSPGLIRFKMNALEDPEITHALYRASQAGVKIELTIRDTCRLRPGLPGISENIQVIGLVGRFLEHARFIYFRNGGDEKYFIGSADCMKRNLESRIEVLVPVEDQQLRKELDQIFEVQWRDRRNAWEMESGGTYVQRIPRNGHEAKGSQEWLMEIAEKRYRAARSRGDLKDKQKKKEFWSFY